MNITVAVVLALASVAAYAAAAALQHRVAARASGAGIRSLVTDGTWWMSTGVNLSGALLHVAALRFGPLTLVQCLGALTVVAAVPLGARAAGRRVSRTERRGIALTLAGFGALLPLTASSSGPGGVLSTPAALGVAVTAALFVPVALSVRASSPRSLTVAAASGVASGAGSALTQTVLHAQRLLSWETAAVAVVSVALAVAGLLLSQTAYAGGLGAPLATLTLANPLASAAIGLALLGERIQGGAAGIVLAVAGAGLAARGVVLLARRTETTVAVPVAPAAPVTVKAPRPVALRTA
ncbi:hypothetical protein [Streptomyces sp. NPDC004270]